MSVFHDKINLIVDADDFWTSRVFNNEMITLCEQNKLTGVSIMVRRGIESQLSDVLALKNACTNKNISLWLHFILNVDEDYKVSIEEQHSLFISLFGQAPTHFDIHKDLPDEEWKKLIREKADVLWIPLRNRWEAELSHKHTDWIRYIAYQKSQAELEEWLAWLEKGKTYEIVFHPWKYDPDSHSNWNAEREGDVKMIHHLYSVWDNYDIHFISQKDI